MIFKGFRFGMLLQFAIGPVCLFIFKTAALKGVYIGEMGVLGVTLVDGIFIIAAILGIASIIDRNNIKLYLKIFGSIILFLFGFSTILDQFKFNFIPNVNINRVFDYDNVFISSVIIAASNPLTIIFWAGIFSTKIAEENIEKQDIYLFGLGAVLSTIFFLSLINLIGSFTRRFLPNKIIRLLNIAVGILLIYFGIRMVLKNFLRNKQNIK